jgi:4-hydroxy-tetrahydrodipicolinate reductase
MAKSTLILNGATGRMGLAIISLIGTSNDWQIAQKIDRHVKLDSGVLMQADMAVDFSSPEALMALLPFLQAAKIPLVTGTTGLGIEQQTIIEQACKDIPIVQSGNMSPGVTVLADLVEKTAKALGRDFDIEIHEAHHSDKKDAPSGTAIMLGEAAAKGASINPETGFVFTRHGQTGPRETGTIGFSVTRGGGIVGDHQVQFIGKEEELTLSHRALDRKLFARGALIAASWLKGTVPGLYTMRDVLGLTTR